MDGASPAAAEVAEALPPPRESEMPAAAVAVEPPQDAEYWQRQFLEERRQFLEERRQRERADAEAQDERERRLALEAALAERRRLDDDSTGGSNSTQQPDTPRADLDELPRDPRRDPPSGSPRCRLRIAMGGRPLLCPRRFLEPYIYVGSDPWLRTWNRPLRQLALALYSDGYPLELVVQLAPLAADPMPPPVRTAVEQSRAVREWLEAHAGGDADAILEAFWARAILVAMPPWFEHWGCTTASGVVMANRGLLEARLGRRHGASDAAEHAQLCVVAVHELGHFACRFVTGDTNASPPRGEQGFAIERAVFNGVHGADATASDFEWVLTALAANSAEQLGVEPQPRRVRFTDRALPAPATG